MSKTTLYLIRHGETVWNTQKKLQGHLDSPLTELGKKQSMWLGEALLEEPLEIIYCSSSDRAYQTAELVCHGRKIEIVRCDELKEMNLGVWEGLTQASAEAMDPEQFRRFWEAPSQFQVENSERFEQVQERALLKLREIIARHQGQVIGVVSHTVVIKLLMAYFENRPLDKIWNPPYIHPTCLCKIEWTEGGSEIILHADISHFKEDVPESS
ncbi:histidine phosphatase family protein [Caldalkalibacillus mannanilyticus]|uniref:histidine phosphatase family protein n=1 Tax=Caldalkalibacillus mannanilyticus TaxID=1418 RepID=UPI00046A44D7|nr:histidine phosphatase family protein [Caldalkalibacillus mannanilyticus]